MYVRRQGCCRRTKSGPVVDNGGRVGGVALGRLREGGNPSTQIGRMGERCKLPHRGLGQSPKANAFCVVLPSKIYAKSAIKYSTYRTELTVHSFRKYDTHTEPLQIICLI